MAVDPDFPNFAGELVGADRRPTTWYYKWFQKLNNRLVATEATATAASEAVAAIPASNPTTINPSGTINVYGDPDTGYTLEVSEEVLALGRVPGPPGRDGEDGADSYVPGPKGDRGDTGDTGPAGSGGGGGLTIIVNEEYFEESWPIVPQAAATGSGSTPTGTGFVHVTGGAQDAAARDPAESEVTFTDVTTNNASTTKHGYLKKLSNVATEYMDGTGAWSAPAGGGSITTSSAYAGANVTIGSVSETDLVTLSLAAGSYLLIGFTFGLTTSDQSNDYYLTDSTNYLASTTRTATTTAYNPVQLEALVVLAGTTTIRLRARHQLANNMTYYYRSIRDSRANATGIIAIKYA